MSKEDLKKEAIQYAVDYPSSYGKGYKHKDLRIAYLAGSGPREKRIAELEKACNETQELLDKQIEATYKVVEENTKLRKDLEELTITNNYQKVISDKNEQISFLEAQIEKMKFDAVKEAFRQGKVIQYNLDGEWVDWSEPTFDDEPCNYRIKEE